MATFPLWRILSDGETIAEAQVTDSSGFGLQCWKCAPFPSHRTRLHITLVLPKHLLSHLLSVSSSQESTFTCSSGVSMSNPMSEQITSAWSSMCSWRNDAVYCSAWFHGHVAVDVLFHWNLFSCSFKAILETRFVFTLKRPFATPSGHNNLPGWFS